MTFKLLCKLFVYVKYYNLKIIKSQFEYCEKTNHHTNVKHKYTIYCYVHCIYTPADTSTQ